MPSNNIKLRNQIEAGKVMKRIFCNLRDLIKAGVTKRQINRYIESEITKSGMIPSFKGYQGYPYASCIAINEEVVHGIPNDTRICPGDMITVDIGIFNNGYHVDAARTYLIEPVDKEMTRMCECAITALNESIKLCHNSVPIKDISNKIEQIIINAGFYPISELTGHAVGRNLQEKPNIPNVTDTSNNQKLVSGMSVAIEPIFSAKKTKIVTKEDGWTIITDPPALAIQIEDTIHITNEDPIILTG